MARTLSCALLFSLLFSNCTDTGGQTGISTDSPTTTAEKDNFVEGKDYILLERARFMDEMGFERPAEAFSVLLPKGWKHEGGITWKDMNGCRGEMVNAHWSASSPDGAIRFESLPIHTWGAASDPMMMQNMQMMAQNGGCEVGEPMDAEHYLRNVFGPRALDGATMTEVKRNEAVANDLERSSAKYKSAAEQYGGSVQVLPSAVIGRLKWSDGTEGIVLCSVMSLLTTSQDMYSGNMQQFSNSTALERSWIRFPEARREEAEKFLATLKSSYRTNPLWQEAVNDFFVRMRQQQDVNHRERMQALADQTAANTQAHNQRMTNIQQQGAANTEAHNQRMANMDQNMRTWETQQSSQDRVHTSFVQTIRGVESYKDGSGSVELSSGYDQAWSRGDGTYILSNSPSFDPSSAFQDQNWKQMERTQ